MRLANETKATCTLREKEEDLALAFLFVGCEITSVENLIFPPDLGYNEAMFDLEEEEDSAMYYKAVHRLKKHSHDMYHNCPIGDKSNTLTLMIALSELKSAFCHMSICRR